ncbi:hypothetical protein FISHEDRAFT_58994 [Fistulina hepatica ATCC 64428]|uniref:DUF6818 domain-containing protein n=1 Tax=Fistulina hepatica ATCC 64428 TaxID=1128425 RepID=A0A0D7AES5_9AGAR|nr:hypothetical protein FISHEDRAFT_58994 [Fistulina hepatica ATCC 64428]
MPDVAGPYIDPRLVALSQDNDNDFPSPREMLKSIGVRPAEKRAGSRRSDPKGKGKAVMPSSGKRKATAPPFDQPEAKRRRGGRSVGTPNYSSDDKEALLDFAEQHLPIGAKGWEGVAADFNEWAVAWDRPERTAKSLELKFKAWIRTSKPTSDAECPPEIERAHEIEYLINSRAETRDLDDDEEDVDEDIQRESDGKEPDDHVSFLAPVTAASIAPKVVRVKADPDAPASVPRSIQTAATRGARPSRASDLVAALTSNFDPSIRMSMQQQRATQLTETTASILMSQQLRDLQAENRRLQTELRQLQQELSDARHRETLATVQMLGTLLPTPNVCLLSLMGAVFMMVVLWLFMVKANSNLVKLEFLAVILMKAPL